jgi:hypothetical protein
MNRLVQASSPYLLQHRDNPVHWWEWGPEAFAEARRLNRPVLLSIGYAACHWCHVMAHESFEDPAVAAVMNEHFVNIKVDREERPDVDHLYMSALHLLGEPGGWPLTMFLSPGGEPFWGGTYFPKELGFKRMVDNGSEGLITMPNGLFYQGRLRAAQLAIAHKLPLMVVSRETLEGGALMSYGPDFQAIFRRTAIYVDKILKGEKTAQLPVELPTKFQFLVNLRTAKALGVTISESFLLRADEVIE